MDPIARARAFLAEDQDPETRAELQALLDANDEAELKDRFSSTLQFGTAGLRGRMGAGTARMNSVVVRRATWGLGRYLLDEGTDAEKRGVVIGFDGRKNSRRFAEDAAGVLAALGIPAHLFADPVPTPLCAFAVTELDAAAGIMVTASHNPPADNGYKVYWGNGAQIIPPHDKGIAACIERCPPLTDLKGPGPYEAVDQGLRSQINADVEGRYLARVKDGGWHPTEGRAELAILYTAMHGVGNHLVRRSLADAGFPRVVSVPSQADPDALFSTVSFPNPEEPGALDEAYALADAYGPHLILANDPDADRISVTVVGEEGARRTLSGNEVGTLLGADAIRHADTGKRADGGDKKKLVITTIVSSTMLGRVARDLGADYAEVLTGFKWIANEALAREAGGDVEFVMGYEEALGVSVSGLVRDKDGVSAIVRLAELAARLRTQGKTLVDELDALAIAHGLSASEQWSVTLAGAEGAARIQAALEALRADPPAALGGVAVARKVDLGRGDAGDGWETSELPPSNVLVFHTDDETRLTVRPSGTEPKIKFYLEAVAHPANQGALDGARAELTERLKRIRGELGERLGL
jgi:phosphomannomutase